MKYEENSDTSLGAPTSGVESKILYAELLKYSSYRQGAIRKLPPSQFTPTWLKNNGTFRPVLIPTPSEEGASAAAIVKTPAGGISAETLVTSLGPTTSVHTFDSPSQEEGPLWTLHQWKLYWNKKTTKPGKPHDDGAANTAVAPSKPSDPPLEGIDKDYLTRLLCLPALQITGTSLESEISAPAAVLSADLCSNLGPDEAIPQAQLPIMLGMYPNRSFVNSTMAPGGASVWIHLVSGTATIAVSPPIPKNVATYAAWACGGKSTGYFLHSKCEGSAKAELVAGDTLLLPPGYTYSLAVTSSAVIVSGGFLRSDNLAIHLDALRIEEAAGIRSRRQYPEFKHLMWRIAAKYSVLLTGLAKNKIENVDISIEGKVASRALETEKEDKKVAEKTAARARAAAAKIASRPSSAAGAAHRQDVRGRRGKRKTDDFIASDSDWSGGGGGGDEDDEGEWVPGARQHRGKADSEENSGEEEEDDDVLDSDAEQMDLEYSDYYDDGNDGGDGGKRRRRQKQGGNKKTGGVVKRVTGERQSKRQRLRRGEDVEAAPPQALNLAGVPPSSLKLKLKLPMMNIAAPPQQPKPSPIKLTIKRPTPPPAAAETAPALPQPSPPQKTDTIPQVDGARDDAFIKDHLELTEGEEQGLPVLYFTLRRWLRESSAAAILASTALSGSSPWTVLARVELALKVLKLIDASDEDHPPPMCVNLTAVSVKTLEPTGAPFQEKLTLFYPSAGAGDDGTNGDEYGDDGDSMDYESGDNVAMIDTFQEDSYFKRRGGGGGSGGGGGFTNRPSSAMGAASDGKGASNGGALGGDTAGDRFNVPATAAGGGATKKAVTTTTTTPGGGGKSTTPLKNSAAAKMKKLSTKDRLKKKLGL